MCSGNVQNSQILSIEAFIVLFTVIIIYLALKFIINLFCLFVIVFDIVFKILDDGGTKLFFHMCRVFSRGFKRFCKLYFVALIFKTNICSSVIEKLVFY